MSKTTQPKVDGAEIRMQSGPNTAPLNLTSQKHRGKHRDTDSEKWGERQESEMIKYGEEGQRMEEARNWKT